MRMSVYAGMIDCMDRGIGRVLTTLRKIGAEDNTVVMFLSDNGASAEYLDSWPNPERGHKPGSITGTADSHRCLEVGWANAANTPFREYKMWVREGGISTPFVVSWPAGGIKPGSIRNDVGHVIDLMPTCLELAGVTYPQSFHGQRLIPLEGKSLVPAFHGQSTGPRTLAWEHEGNRAVREGDRKLVASFRGPWELYNLNADRSECHNLAKERPSEVQHLAALWQKWADRVGVIDWEKLPGSKYRPSKAYRKQSEPVAD